MKKYITCKNNRPFLTIPRPDVQKKIEKLRDVSTVSLNVKTTEEMEKEREKEDAEGSGSGVSGGCGDEDTDDYDSEAEGEPTLEEMEEFATRKIGLKTATATAASSHPYTRADVGAQVWSLNPPNLL